jgi:tetratricopeptide (TPR) repeat protein
MYRGQAGPRQGSRWAFRRCLLFRSVALAWALVRASAALAAGADAREASPVAATPGEPFWLRASHATEASGTPPGPAAPTAGRGGWLQRALDLTKAGRYDAAARAYAAALAAGASDAAVYTNLAEVLMADGRLGEAEARYRDAIAVATAAGAIEVRGAVPDLVLADYGLAVALDRDDQPLAAREMMARASALDPRSAVLELAGRRDGDLFFVPDGEVLYYQGLAASVAGRRAEALEAFRRFAVQLPASRWVRAAEQHIVELSRVRANPSEASGPRIVASGTVLATGGLAAPLVDAAWREQAGILDGCLDVAFPAEPIGTRESRAGIRFAIEIEVDVHGRVTGAVAKVPAPLGETFARCVEAAVKSGLRLRAAGTARTTRARTELIIGVPTAEGAGYR